MTIWSLVQFPSGKKQNHGWKIGQNSSQAIGWTFSHDYQDKPWIASKVRFLEVRILWLASKHSPKKKSSGKKKTQNLKDKSTANT